ncbi:MAG: hypothetical protein HFH79_01850 [Lachnospiraceae bacterium]|jgi:hypothetical protein|nr:hypothetical protein C804_00720 [Lachnospiraceae bacterium A4]MCI8268011.1 hypothetical protein [Lachnospiraceae bacterium]MCI8972324.1 hypothetical protein [Lachnospiraceae bacterium]
MKKRTIMNKIGIAAILMTLSLSMLTGCGNSGDRTSDEVSTEENADTAGMVHLNSADEVSAFMDEVYGGVAEDLLPMEVSTTELDLGDTDMISYHTGLSDLDGIEGIYLSESMMSSTAYSAVYIRTTDEADAEAIRQQLMDNINPAKWICVTAEQQYAVLLGNDIFFVMGHQDTASAVLEKAIAAAESRSMKVSDKLEKANPI